MELLMILAAVIAVVLALLTGFIIGAAVAEDRCYEEAVKRGFGSWHQPVDRERQFVWLPRKDGHGHDST